MIDPVMEALTTLISPLERAMPAMISSAAFPKVAFSNPPKPSPTRAASASVARPIQPATGMMATAEQTKSAVGLLPPGQKRRRIASGTKIRSQSREGLSFRSLGISRLASANQPVRSDGSAVIFSLNLAFIHRNDLQIVAARFQHECFVDLAGCLFAAVTQFVF